MPTWTTPGTYSWVVPAGITELLAVDLAGGEGGDDWSGNATTGKGGRLQAATIDSGFRGAPAQHDKLDEVYDFDVLETWLAEALPVSQRFVYFDGDLIPSPVQSVYYDGDLIPLS